MEFGIFFLYSRNNMVGKTPRPTGTPLKKRGSVAFIQDVVFPLLWRGARRVGWLLYLNQKKSV